MTKIDTVDQLLSVALAAERNAARAYENLAQQMQEYGNGELEGLFQRLASEERKHDTEIQRLADRLGIQPAPDTELPAWQDPHARLMNAEDATNPATSTPYKALAYAVDNEELAFRFFSYVAAMASDAEVKRMAEALAHEELAHAALLRAWRRRAYHAAGGSGARSGLPEPGSISDVPALLAAAMYIQRALLARIEEIEPQGVALHTLGGRLRNELGVLEREAGGTGSTKQTSAQSGMKSPESRNGTDPVREIRTEMDRAFAFYDGVVQAARDEMLGNRAQRLAADMLDNMRSLSDVT